MGNRRTEAFYKLANQQYGLPTELTPKEAFDTFSEKYGGWVRKRSYGLSLARGIDAEDVYQTLMTEAWVAATDKKFDPRAGKSIISYIHQRVVWFILKFYNKRSREILLTDVGVGGTSEEIKEPMDKVVMDTLERRSSCGSNGYLGCNVEIGDCMSGSRSMSRTEDMIEIKQLVERIVDVVKTLPSEFSDPILEVLDPSSGFFDFLSKRREVEKESKNSKRVYGNATRFEVCNSKDLLEYTGTTIRNIEATVSWLKKKIPELKDL